MHFEENNIYHLYNRSNRTLRVFNNYDNYAYFLRKVKKEWLPFFDVLAYCLMPTHFHFMVHVKVKDESNKINNAIGKLQSSYTRAINKAFNTHGSLFQNNTKLKNLFEGNELNNHSTNPLGYALNCFNYIHLNPVKDKLVTQITDWQHSSYLDYANLRTDSICNLEMAEKMFGFERGSEFINLTNKPFIPIIDVRMYE